MAATVHVEKPAPFTFVVSEQTGPFYTRDKGILLAGSSVLAGTPLGQLTASKKLVPLNPAGNDGSQTFVGFSAASHDAAPIDRQIVTWVGPGEVRAADVQYPAGISGSDKASLNAAMLAKGVKLR